VRRAVPSDAGAVAPLIEQFGYRVTTRSLEARLSRLGSVPTVCTVVAQEANEVVGIGMLQTVEILEGDAPLGMLLTLIVDEVSRRRGVGSTLVRTLEQFAREHGCFGVVVQSGSRRIAGHALYRRLGYQQTGERFIKVFAPDRDEDDE
jgi:predicted N-acetyltransferase YhbS